MRHLMDFGLGAVDMVAAVLLGMNRKHVAAAVILGLLGASLMVVTLAGAR